MQHHNGLIHKQRGVIIVFTALALVLLVGMAGLAIDLSHVYTNKTRTQNLADALALSAAISLLNEETEEAAEDYSRDHTLPAFIGADGNSELDATVENSDIDFQFSNSTNLPSSTSDWHSAGNVNARFVRVVIPNDIGNWFLPVLEILIPGNYDEVSVASSAVAGPAPIAPCNLSPIGMCADVNDDGDAKDDECGDGECFGYTVNNMYCLVAGVSNNDNGAKCESSSGSEYSAGNIGILDFSGLTGTNAGANTLAQCIAKTDDCTATCNSKNLAGLQTKTGTNWGPFENAIASIFNSDHPDTGYSSDIIIGSTDTSKGTIVTTNDLLDEIKPATKIPKEGVPPSITLSDPFAVYQQVFKDGYIGETGTTSSPMAEYGKRIFTVPMIDCDDLKPGKSIAKFVGYGCFFITAESDKDKSNITLLGQFIDNEYCLGIGTQTSDQDTGFYKVILYQDLLSGHS